MRVFHIMNLWPILFGDFSITLVDGANSNMRRK